LTDADIEQWHDLPMPSVNCDAHYDTPPTGRNGMRGVVVIGLPSIYELMLSSWTNVATFSVGLRWLTGLILLLTLVFGSLKSAALNDKICFFLGGFGLLVAQK
jgi:hypothetical protein